MQVYDLESDPTQSRNLYDPTDPGHREMLAELIRYRDRLVTGYPQAGGEEPPAEEREALRALGYIE